MVTLDLTDVEVYFLTNGLIQWGGPATLTDSLARVMGYSGAEDFRNGRPAYIDAIRSGASMGRYDWRRVLIAAEINFTSHMLGTGLEWDDVAPDYSDEEMFAAMRSVQIKLGYVPPVEV